MKSIKLLKYPKKRNFQVSIAEKPIGKFLPRRQTLAGDKMASFTQVCAIFKNLSYLRPKMSI